MLQCYQICAKIMGHFTINSVDLTICECDIKYMFVQPCDIIILRHKRPHIRSAQHSTFHFIGDNNGVNFFFILTEAL